MPKKRWLIAADMDGTVIPLEDTAERRAEVETLRQALEARDDLTLAYVTGRDLGLVEAGIERFGLPHPDMVAADVGTSLFHRASDGSYHPDPDYEALMREAMGGVRSDVIRAALSGDPEMELQPESAQGPFKTSYFVSLRAAREGLLDRVRTRLEEAGARVSLVYSVDSLKGVGLLDILPAGIAKDAAVAFLRDHAAVPRDHLVYAGDSGNDRAAMLAGYRVVIVGNAPEPLKRTLRQEAERKGVGATLYFARAPYAAGVLEGLRHWGAVGGEG